MCLIEFDFLFIICACDRLGSSFERLRGLNVLKKQKNADLTTNPLGGCLLQFDNRIVFVCFCVVIFTETSMLLLLVLKAHQHCKWF